MTLTELAIKRPSLIIVIFTVLIGGGLLSYKQLSYQLLPDFAPPILTVTTPYPGASPTTVENEVSKPIQTKFGWHLIKIGDVRDAKALSFELVKDNIRDQLTQDQINKINSQITKDVKVKILAKFGDKANEENAKPAENNAIPENVKPAEVAPASDPSAYEDESAAPAEAVETPELEQATPEAETKSDQTSETTKKIDKKSDEKHKKHKKH